MPDMPDMVAEVFLALGHALQGPVTGSLARTFVPSAQETDQTQAPFRQYPIERCPGRFQSSGQDIQVPGKNALGANSTARRAIFERTGLADQGALATETEQQNQRLQYL
jgi:hypothetical protein